MLRLPDKIIAETIPYAGVDFVNRLRTDETVVSATVVCSQADVVLQNTIVCQGTMVLFQITGGVAGDVTITVVATGTDGSIRKAILSMKIT